MWSWASRSIFCVGLFFVAMPAWPAIVVTDDVGRAVSLPSPALRVVSLAPNLTELLFAAGAGAALVGTVEYSDYPAAARTIPRVGNNGLLDMERIVSLHPDLIVAWWHGGFDRQVNQLLALGVPIYFSDPRTLSDVGRLLLNLGRLTGAETSAEVAAENFLAAVGVLRARYADRRRVSVFYQTWNSPLITINGEQMISDVISLCGGRNVFADLSSRAPMVSIEAVVGADPDAIVTAAASLDAPDGLAMWRRLPRMRAVAGNNLIVIDADLISRQSPRIVDGARVLCGRLDAVRARAGG